MTLPSFSVFDWVSAARLASCSGEGNAHQGWLEHAAGYDSTAVTKGPDGGGCVRGGIWVVLVRRELVAGAVDMYLGLRAVGHRAWKVKW